ncbi:MAG: 30S ribosomal protein S12 methylthiotransferase RimO, partial [Alphaproteobacteria bacterium]|nr:30S ribosomal protein S12 methylthiotransferase RimO [Alphaproteobacteria bacterium]
MKKIALVNHGCAKNLVDSELMLGYLAQKGYEITLDENEADVVIVNTCSFIHDAEKESVRSILQIVDSGKKVIVTGCLPQKHKEELKEAIPEVCAMVGTTD